MNIWRDNREVKMKCILVTEGVIETANHFRCIDMIIDNAKALLTEYNGKEEKTFKDILDFHVKFEQIQPF